MKRPSRLSAFLALVLAIVLPACATKTRPTAPGPVATRAPGLPALIPLPASVERLDAAPFVITADTVIVAPEDDQLQWIARYLADRIGTAVGPRPPRVIGVNAAPSTGAIVLALSGPANAEGYELAIAAAGVTIRASAPAGVFYGVQTFVQLLPPFIEFAAVRAAAGRVVSAPAARIEDAPRFVWRGAMLDVARHFFSVDEVKRYIDLMALYKLNRLHLHLSDDQGWRLEIPSWPRLTSHGGSTEVGGGPGGFYTQDQYSSLVRYAADRFVTIVPEIDVPGHTNAALASHAELNCDKTARELYTGTEVGFSALCVENESTYTFLDDVVREIAAITPGPWFHIGGDEVKTLTADQYRRFIERVHGIVRKYGKQTIGWDEIGTASLDPGTLVQHWRPKTTPKDAVGRGARVIVSIASRTYLDMKYDPTTPIGLMWAGAIDVRTAYAWDPATALDGVPESALAGVEAPLWSETVATMDEVEYLAFPRLAALAEVAWSPETARNWDTFRRRLGAHGPRLTALGVNFYRAPDVPWEP